MKKLKTEEIIVSLTSYPKRINNIEPALKSIFSQTIQPDKIILWLAETEFVNKEKDLPQFLLNLQQDKKIYIEWCPDLKSHKKYFYSMKKYRSSIIITIDDDLIYHKKMIECLLKSYRKFPYAISAMRTHIMQKCENNFTSYKEFTYEQNEIIEKPSMQLLATTGAGTLYPPNIINPDFLNEKIIKDLSIYADDLYIKTIEAIFDIPVVQVNFVKKLKHIPNTQKYGLYNTQNGNGGNDNALKNLVEWTNSKYENNYLLSKIFNIQSENFRQNKKTILYFIPHQDDELLTMGIDINNSIKAGYDVHTILCTNGSATQVKKILNNNQACKYHQEIHSYNLNKADLINARDKEFIESCKALEVKISNIHIPYNRADDKNLTLINAEKIIKKYIAIYGKDIIICTIYFKNGKKQHKDHQNLGYAVYKLYKKRAFDEIRLFKEPYNKSKKKFKQISATKDIATNINKAISAYSYWNPKEGRYAIGLHSMAKEFENLKNNMNNFYFDKKRSFLLRFFNIFN